MRTMYFDGENNLSGAPYNIFDTVDVDVLSSMDTALIISGDENRASLEDSSPISTLIVQSASDCEQADELMADHQYSAMTSQSFLVLEQPLKNYLATDQSASHAGTQCALGISGSDESEKTEGEGGQYDTLLVKKVSAFFLKLFIYSLITFFLKLFFLY